MACLRTTSTSGTRNCLLVRNVLRSACRRSRIMAATRSHLTRPWKCYGAKRLPPCSVVLTFDDGGCDFYRSAFPILRQFNWPATVYLTSYYSRYNRPVFDVMCSYLLWKGRDRILDTTDLTTQPAKFQLNDAAARERVTYALQVFARESRFSAAQKDELLSAIAA